MLSQNLTKKASQVPSLLRFDQECFIKYSPLKQQSLRQFYTKASKSAKSLPYVTMRAKNLY